MCVCAEEKRLSPKEAEKLKALTVKDIDLHIRANAFAHRTGKYAITKTNYENPQAVLRRGQEFKVTVTFNRSYNKDKDDLIFIFDAGMLFTGDLLFFSWFEDIFENAHAACSDAKR